MRFKSSVALLSLVFAFAGPFGAMAQSGGPDSPSQPQSASAPAQASAPDTSAQAAPGQPQVPQPDENGVNWKGVGVGAGTVASNVLYIPAKLAYGILGGIAGGAGYVLTGGNRQVSDTIWRSSLGGDYVVTPDMVTGKDPVHFSGPTDTATPLPAGPDTSATTTNPGDSSTTPNSTLPSVAPSSSAVSSTTTASSFSSSAPAGGSSATHPIDSGAGPVKSASSVTTSSSIPGDSYGGSSAPSSHSGGSSYPSAPGASASDSKSPPSGAASATSDFSDSSTAKPKSAPLPDTSIE